MAMAIHPVQFLLQGDIRPFRQTGHATERNNYGTVAQFPDLAIERSPASFPSADPFQPFFPSVFSRATRDAKPFSSVSYNASAYVQRLKAST